MVIVVPMASAPSPRSSAVVEPRTATRAGRLDRGLVQERALPDARSCGPSSVVGGGAEDRWSSCSWCPPRPGPGWRSRARRRPRRRARAIAAASSTVRVVAEPAAPRVKPLRGAARVDGQQVGAEALELLRDAAGGALPHGDQRDHRRDADDHAEHRQGGPQPGRAEPRERQADELEGAHRHQPPVADVDLAFGRRRDVRVVRDEHDGSPGAVQLVQAVHHLARRTRCRGCRSARRRG